MIAILLSGCATGPRGSYCDLYSPVKVDLTEDTEDTINQAVENNAIYFELCDQ